MKRSIRLALSLGLALAAPMATGCAGEDSEAEGAKFPEAVGSDEPLQTTPQSQAAADLSAPPPVPIPAPVDTSDPAASDVAIGGSDGSEYADTDPSALTDFRSALDPYGAWVDDPTYGTVWEPDPSVVGSDFQPYVSDGSWSYDDSGDYVWNSDYDWGWAPFHYGRWAYIGTGWGWIPGREYAGAWVSWRSGGGYIGWAPLPPTWYWRGGYAFGLGAVPYAPYSFCGYHDVFSPHVGGRIVTGSAVPGVAKGTQPYVPAHPTVGGAVAGGANGTTGATGRTPAHPVVSGPTPSSIGLSPREITRTPVNSAGLAQARAFARPSTAQSLGAHAPAASASASNAYGARPTPMASAATRMPAYGSAHSTLVASSPRYQGVAPAPYHSPSYSSVGHYGGSTYGNGSAYGSGRAYGSYPSYGGGAARSSPSSSYYGGYGARPGYGYGGVTRGGGVVRSGGTTTSGSSSSSSSEPGYGVPSHHSSGGFRGGGGFHGGGAGGGGHAGGGGRR